MMILFSNYNVISFLQRYLYPVDKTRIDASGMIEETTETTVTSTAAKESSNGDKSVRKSKRLKAE